MTKTGAEAVICKWRQGNGDKNKRPGQKQGQIMIQTGAEAEI